MSNLPAFSMAELIEAGVHFGHKTKRWNPRMAPYIYGVRNDIHIINLGKTVPMLHKSLAAVRDVVAKNGRVLFVGTKRQAADPIAEAAKRCGQYYINQRWLGGLLTNWSTIQNSIRTLRKLDEIMANPAGRGKKELVSLNRQRMKLEASLGGIKDMGGQPDLLFIIDTNKEDLAINEAKRLNIPIVAIIDSNSSLEGISYPIPGNDDSTRAIKLYCQLVSDAVLAGLQQSLVKSGKDMGEREDAGENISAEALKAAKAEDAEEQKKGRGNRGSALKNAKKAPTVMVKKTPGKVPAKKAE